MAEVAAMTVFVADERSEPPDTVEVDLGRLRRLADHVMESQHVPAVMELSVLCVDRAVMAELNGRHMGGDGPTDVLAFPIELPGETAPGQPAILGDVVVCPAVAADQAEQRDDRVAAEIDLLVVHGILHLLGHDHADPAERDTMFSLSAELLDDFSQHEPVT